MVVVHSLLSFPTITVLPVHLSGTDKIGIHCSCRPRGEWGRKRST